MLKSFSSASASLRARFVGQGGEEVPGDVLRGEPGHDAQQVHGERVALGDGVEGDPPGAGDGRAVRVAVARCVEEPGGMGAEALEVAGVRPAGAVDVRPRLFQRQRQVAELGGQLLSGRLFGGGSSAAGSSAAGC
ncbi:hypothetical protein [Streptomyces rapamycinicus]|uniref:Uncharacterized protein n=2 Tax=Streptomyces rapamycinicus TaxID=1226757 RepID=A0A0A0NDY7_STRRN|nr:hypothetical protein [Streptomyces rapamycinicus]AGP55426.1 hypothetical protein M271_19385 [Streptomyces rapamycinicus NRRL 5491]MBB4782986.1 hypothetical protein [Streptomyces rapamycinicus]RLV81539.1 hypothetical protein D3C57_124180 [Streptomyces rapamycinicus NRRL 5491]UTO63438.1 hypothetical protein LJB45_14620 [Streptomyces rapamycinicus]UTP31395.1 hypothetical protein LIV37_19735 [Streptomyces rapamycinicus NRRL 5491]